MKYLRFLSLLLAVTLAANFTGRPTFNNNNYGIAICEESPLSFVHDND